MQKVYVWNGNVYVQWANEGLWYGDKVLVGIVDGYSCATTITLSGTQGCFSSFFDILVTGCTPLGPIRMWVQAGPYFQEVYTAADGNGMVTGWNYTAYSFVGTHTIYAEDQTTGCVSSFSVEISDCS